MVDGKKVKILVQLIERTEEALREEDLGLALKWMLRQREIVLNPENTVNQGWYVESTPLHKSAIRYDETKGTAYAKKIKILGEVAKLLAASYQQRKDAGLVLVVENNSAAEALRRAGFSPQYQYYSKPSSDVLPDDSGNLSEYSKPDVLRMDRNLDAAVKRILELNHKLVIAPFNRRTWYKFIDERLEPDGIQMQRKLAVSGRDIKFLGLSSVPYEAEYWTKNGIPHVSLEKKDLVQGVRHALGITYESLLTH